MPKDFLTLEDYTAPELIYLLEEGIRMKNEPGHKKYLEGKTIGMIFSKSSTRTRVGFEVGMYQLGGHAIMLKPDDIQLGRGESLSDTAMIMSRYVNGLVVRTYEQSDLEELAASASVPVINALTDKYHPCQAVADYMTLLEQKGDLKGLRLAYIGDGNNVAHSLIVGAALLGVDLIVATPKGYEPHDDVMANARSLASQSGATVDLIDDPRRAVEGADAVYTDVWASMGHETEAVKRRADFTGFTVDVELMKRAKPDACVMHCLPAHRGEEITGEVLDGSQSVVLDQAENKMHAQKSILKMALED